MIWWVVDRWWARMRPQTEPKPARWPQSKLIGLSLLERVARRRAWAELNEIEEAAGVPATVRPRDQR